MLLSVLCSTSPHLTGSFSIGSILLLWMRMFFLSQIFTWYETSVGLPIGSPFPRHCYGEEPRIYYCAQCCYAVMEMKCY